MRIKIERKKWKKTTVALLITVICMLSACPLQDSFSRVQAEEVQAGNEEDDQIKPSELYAQSAVLMDAGSGRILYAKNGQEALPMASTTKIMTCILALEKGDLSDPVSVSSEASAQPAVKLGMRSGQEFYLRDLLYSLMLESHNDSAVAIAEHIGGSVQGFADMMNAKAEELGCEDTYFITPNGLDAQDDNGIHHTTAADLAQIMKYCIMDSDKSEEFLEITRRESYSFSDCAGNGNYSCVNHNSFLKMMDGALSGKTGFTADAGYCYVGALQNDGRTFIVALLACGWPNNKSYKWADTKKLMNYGIENYFYQEIRPTLTKDTIKVADGFNGGFPQKEPVELKLRTGGGVRQLLLKQSEQIEMETDVPSEISAPVEEGERLGSITYTVDGRIVAYYPVFAAEDIEERSLKRCVSYLTGAFLF